MRFGGPVRFLVLPPFIVSRVSTCLFDPCLKETLYFRRFCRDVSPFESLSVYTGPVLCESLFWSVKRV